MQLIVNGQQREMPSETTVDELVQSLGAPGNGRGVAVALGGAVVPKSEWADTALQAGDRVEVLIAVQGG